mmetsp:Transcript_5587/g.10498  ORF Transcript_5587/g.10498 Transcript_5587/m.10498 type:complete len:218 (-) Transcript_5587:358-1011(-)
MRRATTPERARLVTALRASERFGRETRPPTSERKMQPHSSARPARKGTRPPYCSSTASARQDAIVVNDEKICRTGLKSAEGLALLRSGKPANSGTRGNARKLANGSAPGRALDETKSHQVAAKLATKSEASSLCDRASRGLCVCCGFRTEIASVIAWTAAMTGQMRKTYDAGVIEVAKYELNWALDVAPKFLVSTEASVAIGMFADGMPMVAETRPK